MDALEIILLSVLAAGVIRLFWLQYEQQKRMMALNEYLRKESERTELQERFRLSQEYVHNTHYIYDWERPHEEIILPEWSGDYPVPSVELYAYLHQYGVTPDTFYDLVRMVNRRQYKRLAKLVLRPEELQAGLTIDEIRPILSALVFVRRDSMPYQLMIDPDDNTSESFAKTIRLIRVVTLMFRSITLNKDKFYELHVNDSDVNLSGAITDEALHKFFEAVLGAYWRMTRDNELPFATSIFNDITVKECWLPTPTNDIGDGVHQIVAIMALMTAYSIITGQAIPSCLSYSGKLAIQFVNRLRTSTQTLRVV